MEKKPEDAMLTATCMLICAVVIICVFVYLTALVISKIQSNIALLRRAVLANLLWEDVAYVDGARVAEEIKRLIPLCNAQDVYNIALMKRADVDRRTIQQGLKNLKSSMLLPLDFLKTARMNPEFERDIEDSMLASYANLPKLPGKTLFIVDVSGSMSAPMSSKSDFTRYDAACAMAMLAVNQCEDYEIVTTAGNDGRREGAHEHIKYPQKGFGIIQQIKDTNKRIGGGGIFTRQCLNWCKSHVGKEFDRIIVFSDSQDCDFPNLRIPEPYGTYNYICDVSANTKGVNYRGKWTAEISGFSEHFLTYIAALEGIENKFEEQ